MELLDTALDLSWGVLRDLRKLGAAHIPQALSPIGLAKLSDALRDVELTSAPVEVGSVRQVASLATIAEPLLGRRPTLRQLALELEQSFSVAPWLETGVSSWRANEATVMRYPVGVGGISPHLDGRRYSLIVASFSIAGTGRLTIPTDRTGVHERCGWVCAPGDLVLLRGPGFDACRDGRMLHAAGPPECDETRVSLTLRMDKSLPRNPAPPFQSSQRGECAAADEAVAPTHSRDVGTV